MIESEKISKINQVLDEYFKTHSQRILAKDFMPEFIKVGIFPKDNKNHTASLSISCSGFWCL